MQALRSRTVLLGVLILIGAGTALLVAGAQQRVAALQRDQREVGSRLEAMVDSVDRLALAQEAYVAAGQPSVPWLEQFSANVQSLTDEIAAVRPLMRSERAAAALKEADDRLNALVDVDGRVREHLRSGEDLLAADAIFSDGRAALEALAAPLRALRQDELGTFEAERSNAQQVPMMALAAAAFAWVAGLVLLVRTPAAAAAPVAEIKPPQPPVEARPDIVNVAPPAPIEASAPPPLVDFAAAADVCTALSRLTSTSALPDLLARAAAVLEASGLIVWMGAGEELFAATSHGYDPRVIGRLGPIARHADNATAASWRTGELRAVPGDMVANGAIVAPMFGPDACIGVLAAEVRSGREEDGATRAVTALIAAQLATALSAWPAASSGTAPTAATGT